MTSRAFHPAILPLILCCFAIKATCHGYLARPVSRNLFAADPDLFDPKNSCPHCLNGGGVDQVSEHGALSWPEGRRTLSGDSLSDSLPRPHEAGGMFYRAGLLGDNWTVGSVVEMKVVTTTNHNGRFGFRVCEVSGGFDTAPEREARELTDECLDRNVLLQAAVPGAQAPGERWFYTSPEHGGQSTNYTMYYQLPENLECDGVSSHCVLQWYWLTFNSCQTRDSPERYTRSENRMKDCEEEGASYPEEFENLSDVVIVKGGASDSVMESATTKSAPVPVVLLALALALVLLSSSSAV
jgi:hypothetical protein